MRTLALALLATTACSSDNKATPDAPAVKIVDAPPDAAPDAFIPPPPDAPPTYDFSCFGKPQPTTATDPVHVTGTTESVGNGGLAAAANVTVDTFKVGGDTAIDTVISDSQGNYTTGALVTGGVPLDAYQRANDANKTYRTSYLFPPAPVAADFSGAPTFLVTPGTFSQISQLGQTQDDTNNGALVVLLTDCSSTQVAGGTLTVTENGNPVGKIVDLGAFLSQATGLFFVFNVPAGTAHVSATVQGKTYPGRDVIAFKKDDGINSNGTISVTNLRPGP